MNKTIVNYDADLWSDEPKLVIKVRTCLGEFPRCLKTVKGHQGIRYCYECRQSVANGEVLGDIGTGNTDIR